MRERKEKIGKWFMMKEAHTLEISRRMEDLVDFIDK